MSLILLIDCPCYPIFMYQALSEMKLIKLALAKVWVSICHYLFPTSKEITGGFEFGCSLDACSDIATIKPADFSEAFPRAKYSRIILMNELQLLLLE